ncbi:hypothetical protein IFR05_014651 [Cadophora sp. M221]|nr:hypothetical protein IFR05_014651 [Cadophora sp. M221]
MEDGEVYYSSEIATLITNPQKDASNPPQSRIPPTFLVIPTELRRMIFDHALTTHSIELYSSTPNNPNPNQSLYIPLLLLHKTVNAELRHWLLPKPNLQHITTAGLFNPQTTIWKTNYPTIRENAPSFTNAWNNPVFQRTAEILLVDMPFNPSLGEDKWRIQERERCIRLWTSLAPFPKVKRIDLLSHGKLESSSKVSILDGIFLAMELCGRNILCEICEEQRPMIRWRNVNRVNGKWRELKPWMEDERRRYEDIKDWVACRRWGISVDLAAEYNEEDLEDFSEEEDEDDEDDVPEFNFFDGKPFDITDEEADGNLEVVSGEESSIIG